MSRNHTNNAAWKRLRSRVLRRDRNQCQIKGPRCTGRATEVDHIVAKSQGGTDDLANLRAVCHACHAAKSGDETRAYFARRRNPRGPERHPSESLSDSPPGPRPPTPWDRAIYRSQRTHRRRDLADD